MNQNNGRFAGSFVMLFSAAIFGFFGFSRDWSAPFPDGKVIPFMVLLGWTLKVSAAMFLTSGVLSFVKPIAGHLLYALTGVAAAGLFLVVVVMDVTDTTHMVMRWGWVVLLFFAVWNGYGSWLSLRSILGSRQRAVLFGGGPDPADGE